MGQGSPNTWHNPNNFMVKPFAIVIFLAVFRILEDIIERRTIEKKRFIKIAIFAELSVFEKPSFLQGFLPALVIYLLINAKTYLKHIKKCVYVGCRM